MPPRNMISPAKMNNGIASSDAEPAPAAICCTTTIGGKPRYSRVGQRRRRQRERHRHADQQQQARTPRNRRAIAMVSRSSPRAGAGLSTMRASANNAISAPPSDNRADRRRSAARPRRPCATSRPSSNSSAPQNASSRADAGDSQRAQHLAERAARSAARLRRATAESGNAVAVHAGGGAEAHRGAQQQHRHRFGPARRIVEHVAGDTPASPARGPARSGTGGDGDGDVGQAVEPALRAARRLVVVSVMVAVLSGHGADGAVQAVDVGRRRGTRAAPAAGACRNAVRSTSLILHAVAPAASRALRSRSRPTAGA